MKSLSDATGRWKVAQSLLFDAIDAFRGACAELEVAVDWTRRELSDRSSAEAAIQDVAARLPDIESHRRHLYSAELGLCRMFNTSASLAPISKLPPEIFCSTLSLAIRSSDCIVDTLYVGGQDDSFDPGTQLAVLQLVCSRWRHVVVNTPSLWSHVDVLGSHPAPDGDFFISRLTRIRLGRAAGAPICLHFHKSVREYPDFRVAMFLRPYLRSACSLVFSNWSQGLLVRAVLEVCSNHDAPDPIISPPAPHSLGADLLQATHFNWPKRTLHGITYLQIELLNTLNGGYDLDHLLAILSSNPLIRTLRIHAVPLNFDHEPRSSARVSLPHLELLQIGDKTAYNFLSMLEPGMVGLDLRLDAPRSPEELVAIRSFSERSRIKSLTLKVIDWVDLPDLSPCISSMPHLRALFLSEAMPYSSLSHRGIISNTLLTGDVPILDHLPTPGHIWTCSAAFPNIKIFGLASFRGWIDGALLELAPLVATCSLDLLVLANCTQPPNPPGDPEVWSWVSKHVKSTAILARGLELGKTQEPWDLFMETLWLERSFDRTTYLL